MDGKRKLKSTHPANQLKQPEHENIPSQPTKPIRSSNNQHDNRATARVEVNHPADPKPAPGLTNQLLLKALKQRPIRKANKANPQLR